ncbi:hypothetical protein O53_2567 [Microcystis aeruginosa TAIHU98]|uniref:Uncharacterized protein n=2 Tax=Microcystis aeruginosa TaxID=1126 RepID=L7E2T3_MICAE|nr:hypothetical protein O53_2567 [Microcystis aeruginosa TAIHU98]GCE60393.1 hypothetical protein MiAbB_02314 [Microcystis aeruginosa NIES-4285]
MALLDPKTVISPAKLKDYLLVLLPKDDKSQYLAQAGYNQDNWVQVRKRFKRANPYFRSNSYH